MFTVLSSAGIILAVVLVVMTVTLWHGQERIVFQPPGPPHPDGGGARRIDFQAADGQPLFAYLVEAGPPTEGLVIVFHGNADLAAWQIPWATEVSRRTGRAVLLPEYRGYAGLSGEPTYRGSHVDARAIYSVARDSLGVAPERIAFFGHSLGSAIATELARDVPPEVLVLLAPLTSVRDMASLISPVAMLLYRLRGVRVQYDTEAIVRSLDTPVWVAHGTDDQVIPLQMGRRVFAAARLKGELLIIPGADHNTVIEHGGDRYWSWLMRALGHGPPAD